MLINSRRLYNWVLLHVVKVSTPCVLLFWVELHKSVTLAHVKFSTCTEIRGKVYTLWCVPTIDQVSHCDLVPPIDNNKKIYGPYHSSLYGHGFSFRNNRFYLKFLRCYKVPSVLGSQLNYRHFWELIVSNKLLVML